MSAQQNISLPLTALRSFEALIRTANVISAAAELNVTNSAVLHQLRSLEEFCGKKLVTRNKNNVTATETGDRLFNVCNASFEALQEVLFELRLGDQIDSIEILILRSANHYLTTQALNGFISDHNDVSVNVTLKQSMRDEALEYYKAIFTIDSLTADLFRTVVFLSETLLPVGRADYLQHLSNMNLAQPVRILTVEEKGDESEKLIQNLREMGFSNFNYISFVNRRDAVKAATEGIGITLADPGYFEEEFVDNSLSVFSECALKIKREYSVLIKRSSESEKPMRALLKRLKIKPLNV